MDSATWELIGRNLWPMLVATVTQTIPLTAISFVLGLVIALFVALARLSTIGPLSAVARVYISLIRGTPLLVQLFLLFFGLPQFGIVLPAFACGVLGLGLYSGAYVSEIVRGAIQSIDKGQTMAAQSLGMTPGTAMRQIVVAWRKGSVRGAEARLLAGALREA